MLVALDSADHHGALRFHPRISEQRFQKPKAGVHRTGGKHHFRDKHLVCLEFFTDHIHAGQQPIV